MTNIKVNTKSMFGPIVVNSRGSILFTTPEKPHPKHNQYIRLIDRESLLDYRGNSTSTPLQKFLLNGEEFMEVTRASNEGRTLHAIKKHFLPIWLRRNVSKKDWINSL